MTLVEKVLNKIPEYVEKGCPLHFVNLSSNIGLDKIRQLKKKKGTDKLTNEITPHHLYFSSIDIAERQTIMKCYPPIRDSKEQNIFAISLKRHYFDMISSAHFPVAPMYKNSVQGNFFKAFNGVSTLGFSLQVLWTLFF